MQIPMNIKRYIREQVIGKANPLCLILDEDGEVLAFRGSLVHYGFRDPVEGTDERLLDLLTGLDGPQTTVLPFVETPSGRVAHLHVVPSDGQRAIICFDASEDYRHQRIQQQKTHEIEILHEKQKRLMASLRQVNEDLALKKTQLEEANRVKGNFISRMSHEFRTPLTAILGYSEVLKKNHAGEEEERHSLEAITRGARYLLSLIENILDQALLEAGKVTIQPVATDLRDLCEDLKFIFFTTAKEKGLSFETLVDPSVPTLLELDEVRLRQILVNLAGNAVKFTWKGSVRITGRWENGLLRVEVADTGPGIPAEIREKVFQPFQRSEKSKLAGAGLGLAISHQLAGLMGGHIDFESSANGTRFHIAVPAPEMATKAASTRSDNASPKTILVAEDDPDILALLTLLFDEEQHRLQIVKTGEEAVAGALRDGPDLVVMDMNMPVLNGYQAMQILREKAFGKPIIAMTASTDERDKQRAFQAGCSHFLLKPIHIPHFLSLIELCLEESEACGRVSYSHSERSR